MIKQLSKYNFDAYCYPERWASYYYQISEILNLKPKSLLEIGVGDSFLGKYIKNNTDIFYKSLDSDRERMPDILSSVDKIPLDNNSFDAVCAFEVLEHLPFEKFEKALAEMSRVARSDVVLSLPHFGPPVKFLIKLPFLPEIKFAFKIPFARKHIFNGQYYWEIGKRGYSAKNIRAILEKYFTVKKEFIPFGNQYHHFYILKKK